MLRFFQFERSPGSISAGSCQPPPFPSMTTLPAASTDDDSRFSLEPHAATANPGYPLYPSLRSQYRPSARNRSANNSSSSNTTWRQSNGSVPDGRAVQEHDIVAHASSFLRRKSILGAAMAEPLPTNSSTDQPTDQPPRSGRSLWSLSISSFIFASVGIALLLTILTSLVVRELDPKGCRMSYMRPSYVRFSDFDTEHTRFATKYSLYLYRELGIDDEARVCVPFLSSSLFLDHSPS